MRPQFFLTPVVKNLIIINVLIYFLTHVVMPNLVDVLAVHFPTSPDFKPVQLISHMFMHGSVAHIFFNMFGLATFGPKIELVWKEQRFLIYYLACGFGAMLFQWAWFYYQAQTGSFDHFDYKDSTDFLNNAAMLGASGCLFGLLVAFAVNYPEEPLGFMFLPFQMPAKYAVFVFAAIEVFAGVGRFGGNIGHFAHLGGAVTGAILIFSWYKTFK